MVPIEEEKCFVVVTFDQVLCGRITTRCQCNTINSVCVTCVCVTCVCVCGGRHWAVPQGVGVLVVLRESHPPHAGVQHHRGAALAQRAVAGRPGHHGLQRQSPDSAHAHPTDPTNAAQGQVVVQREVVQAIRVQL